MNYAKLIPDDSFIGEYLQVSDPLETSQAYDFWCAMWVLGTCLGRDVIIPRPHAPVYMNWYVMLVAESGVTRKSTAVRIARDTVSHILGLDHLVEGRSTPEYLFTQLSTTSHMAIAVSELVTFLGKESYVIELPALLTDLYDCPPEKRGGTVSRGERIIQNAFVTFLSASTPTWLMGAVNPSVIEGGFTSRCMFVLDEKPKRKVPWPLDAGAPEAMYSALQRTCDRAREAKEIHLLPAAMRRYERWYKGRETTTDVPFLASFYAREDAHVLRCAACLAINDDTLAIDRKHIDVAIKLITQIKAGALQIFAGGGTSIRIAQGLDKMERMLIEAGGVGVAHTPFYAAVRHFMSSTDFKIALEYMNELGMLTIGIEQRKGGGPKPKRYFRTNDLEKRDRRAALREALL